MTVRARHSLLKRDTACGHTSYESGSRCYDAKRRHPWLLPVPLVMHINLVIFPSTGMLQRSTLLKCRRPDIRTWQRERPPEADVRGIGTAWQAFVIKGIDAVTRFCRRQPRDCSEIRSPLKECCKNLAG